MNLFFVIKTVLHLAVTTFFEYESSILYKKSISESENMWSRKMLIYSHFTDRFPAYFFECEMNISFINIVSELKNMRDIRRFQIKRYN